MNFLNPLLLYGLVGLGLPILIHQLTRQSRRDRMLPTVQFLKQASEHTRRWRKLREWLLLILRTLIITAIVFAFARPYLPGVTAGTGKQRKNNVIILVDTSASMGYQKNGSSRLRVARQKVRGLLSELGSSSTVSLIGFSDTVTEVVRKSSPDNTLIKLNKLNQSYRGTDLSRALAYASSFKKPRKVFLLSDLGKNGFSSLKDQSFPELTDDLKIIDLSLDKPRNTWVKSVRRLPGSRNKVTVKTRSSHGRKNGSLNIKTGKFSKSIPLGNSSKQSRILEVPGLPLEGQVQIKGDSFPLDNTHYFVVRGQSGGTGLWPRDRRQRALRGGGRRLR
ncbi:MAG: BatA domain-containing protein, partial [bacterium]